MNPLRLKSLIFHTSTAIALIISSGVTFLADIVRAEVPKELATTYDPTNDSGIFIADIKVTGAPGPDHSTIVNGNLKFDLPLGTLNTQAGSDGHPDEGLGRGVTIFPCARVQANGEVWIREADGSTSKYDTSGISKNFVHGELSTVSKTSKSITRNHQDGSYETFSHLTPKGTFITASGDRYRNETRYNYDVGNLFPREIVSPESERITKITKSADGTNRIGSVVSSDGDTMTFSYVGPYLKTIKDLKGKAVVSIERDTLNQGLPVRFESDGKYGLQAEYSLDKLGGTPFLKKLKYPGGKTVEYRYSRGMAQIKELSADNSAFYNDYHLVTLRTGRVVIQREYLNKSDYNSTPILEASFDLSGRLLAEKNSYGHTTTFTYSEGAPLPKTITRADGTVTSITYSPLFLPQTIDTKTPAGSLRTVYTWDTANPRRLMSIAAGNASNPQRSKKMFTYEGQNLWPSSITETSTTDLKLSAAGLPTEAMLPNGGSWKQTRGANFIETSLNGISVKDSWAITDTSTTFTTESPLYKTTSVSDNNGFSEQKEFIGSGGKFPAEAARTQTAKVDKPLKTMVNANPLPGSEGFFGVTNAMALVSQNNPVTTTYTCKSIFDNCEDVVTCKESPSGPNQGGSAGTSSGGCELTVTTVCQSNSRPGTLG